MEYTFIIGNTAALLTSVSFLPQAVKIIKTKNTDGISLPMYMMFVSGIILWLIYGVIRNDLPIILANVVTLSLSGLILFLKIRAVLKQRKNY